MPSGTGSPKRRSYLVAPAKLRSLVRRLAAVTGHPVGGLARALRELRVQAPDWRTLRRLAQRACPQCTACHEGGSVRRLFATTSTCASDTGTDWPTRPDARRPPPRLAGRLPEPVAGQHRLRRTERRCGWAATFDATAAATKIYVDRRFSAEAHPLWMRWERRLELLMPTGYRRSVFIAAIFPEVAALAAVLAAPDWPPAGAAPGSRAI